ncbi:MAG: SURF1 family protein [Actinocatenispora sp.]
MSDAGRPRPAPSISGVLRTPRWVLYGLLAVVLAVAMVFLGRWQMHRYEERSGINARIDTHAQAAPVPVTDVLRTGHPPADQAEYTRVTMTGRYDRDRLVLARARTVDGTVGYEVLVPLRLDDGHTVLVDRGWLPPRADTVSEPAVPPAPRGEVTVVGQVRLPESGTGSTIRHDGHVEVRRINPADIAGTLPYPVLGGYVTLTGQTPAAPAAFTPIPVEHQNAALNFSYIVQWWLFAGMALIGFGVLVRWESRKRAGLTPRGPSGQASRSGDDRLSDDRVPEDRVPEDRVPEDGVPGGVPRRGVLG